MKQSKTKRRVWANVLAVAMLLGLVSPATPAQADAVVESGAITLTEYSSTPDPTKAKNKRIQFTAEAGVSTGGEEETGYGFAEGTTGFLTRNGEDINDQAYLYCYPDHGYYQIVMDDLDDSSPATTGDVVAIEGTFVQNTTGFTITIPKTRFKCMGNESEGYYWGIIENVDTVTWSDFVGRHITDEEGNEVSLQGKTFVANLKYSKDESITSGSHYFYYAANTSWNGIGILLTYAANGGNTLQVVLEPKDETAQTLTTLAMTDEEIMKNNLLRIDFPEADKDGCGYLNISWNGEKLVDNEYIDLSGYGNYVHRDVNNGPYSNTVTDASASTLATLEKAEIPVAEVDALTVTDYYNGSGTQRTVINGNSYSVLGDSISTIQGKTFVAYLKYTTCTETQYATMDVKYFGSGTGADKSGVGIYMEKLSDGTYNLTVKERAPGSNTENSLATYNMSEAEITTSHQLRVDFPLADENNQGYLTVSLDEKRLIDHYLLSNVSDYGNYIQSIRSNDVVGYLRPVSRPVLDRLKALDGPRANVAYIEKPETGIINPAVVVTRVEQNNIESLIGSAVALMDIDNNLNVLDGETTIGTVARYMRDYEDTVIPAFYLDSEAEMTAICQYLKDNNVIDAFYVVSSENADLLKKARETWGYARGVIEYDTIPADYAARAAIRRQMHENLAFIGIFPTGALDADISAEYNLRGLSVWSYAEDAGDVYAGISGGVNGLIASAPNIITDVYESITVKTLSGKPMTIAHRGTTGTEFPENTIMAYKGMVEKYGASACEMDLNLTKDNVVILMSYDNLEQTTDGEGTVTEMTLAQIKELNVDTASGVTDKVPTLEEVFEAFKETDTVLYLHVNYNYDEIKSQLPVLVEKHGMEDNVVIFARGSIYENTTNLAYVGGNRAAGPASVEQHGNDPYYAVESLISYLGPRNQQMLPTNYDEIGTDDSLSYAMSARGLVFLQSTTNGEANLDKYFINGTGNTAILTDFANQISDYNYQIDTQDTAFVVNETIDLSQKVKKIVGDATVSCGLVQVGGDTLAESEEGYTLSSAGSAEVVYYADISITRASYGTLTYRLYSAPVTVKMVEDIYLGDPDLDGQHTVIDLIKAKKATFQTKPSLGLYDLNNDSYVNNDDIPYMQKLILGIYSIGN